MNNGRSLGTLSTVVLVAALLLAGFGPAAAAPAMLPESRGGFQTRPYSSGRAEAAACQEWLANGDFERGTLDAWVTSGAVGLGDGRESAHGAWLGGADNAAAELLHPALLPAEASEITLTFWWLASVAVEQPGDLLTVAIQHGEVSTPLLTLPAAAPLNSWQEETVDLGGYAGRAVGITFLAATDGGTPATFRLDDVRLSVCGSPPSDLVVADAAWDEGKICYVLANEGEGMAPGGHHLGLSAGGAAGVDWVYVEIAAGQHLWGCFDFEWVCTPLSDEIVVRADELGWVAESDETNNERSESWWCDPAPPQITAGPAVSGITAEAATVTWTTDEASDSVVRYGLAARELPLQASGGAAVTAHSVTLSGLQAATTYQLQAGSTDASGNRVESELLSFQTLAAADTEDPTVSIRDPGECRGTVTIVADAWDNQRVAQMAFSVDGAVVWTDYEPPFEYPMETPDWPNGPHTVGATVGDAAGRFAADTQAITIANLIDHTTPTVVINSPANGATVSGKVDVSVTLGDDVGVCAACFYVDGAKKECASFPACPQSPYHEFGWYTTGTSDGNHTVGVEALDKPAIQSGGQPGYGTVTVKVDNAPPAVGQPDLGVAKLEVFQHGATFVLELTLKNTGPGWADNITINDYMQGFQPIEDASTIPASASNEGHYDAATHWARCETQESTVGIAPGASELYVCAAVPVLLQGTTTAPPSPSIGSTIQLSYQSSDGIKYNKSVSMSVLKTTQTAGSAPSLPLGAAHANAIGQSDYLLVTNPGRLQAELGGLAANVDLIVSAMADLAGHKWGVLGYLETNSASVLRSLIVPKGPWASQFKNGFYPWGQSIGGYLLIVGETEIVPAWDITSVGDTVEHSEHSYADTYADFPPELIVGRVIGDDLLGLLLPLRHATTSGPGFGRAKALLISGTGNGQDNFVENVEDAHTILQNKGFNLIKMHWNNYGSDTQRLLAFQTWAPNQDLIFFRDHGLADSWYPALTTNEFPIGLGSTHPLLLASACLTGDYEAGPDYGIAEAFFHSGAAQYIGSTEVSDRGRNSEASLDFFGAWNEASAPARSAAEAFTLVERTESDSGNTKWERWVAEYNIYGDPKLGKAVSPPAAAAARATAAPLSTLTVELPDYEVRTANGKDRVRIPGGEVWLVADQPAIPYYAVTVDYPPGTRIQGVTLTERSGLEAATGLDLPLTSDETDGPPAGSAPTADEVDVWLPGEEFEWDVVDHPDNSVTLVLSVYAFHYNPFSTDVRFYKHYTFEVEHTTSSVAVTALATDQFAYAPGEPVHADLALENAGAAQDVVVEAVVRRYLGGEQVAGLLLRTLQGLAGPASFAAEWDGAGAEPGYYRLEVVLRDTAGDELDRETALFRLGIAAGEITAFTAAPQRFRAGDEVALSLRFRNSGTVPIDGGRAVIRIWDGAGEVVQEFRHDVAVEPGGELQLDDVWDTSGLAEAAYRAVATVTFDSQAAEPWTVELGPWLRTYLPLVMRQSP